jgi:hypothetical protein
MSRLLAIVFVGLCAAASLTSCTAVTPMNGTLYTDVQGPVAVGPATLASKRGEASATAVLGIAVGDVSIETAMKNGGITKVHHVDTKVMNVLGIYAVYTTVVYGE